MTMNKFLAPLLTFGLAMSVTGCFDQSGQQVRQSWKMHEVKGTPIVVNEQTGEFFALNDGNLIEVPKISQKDLAARTLGLKSLLSLPMDVHASMKYSADDLKMVLTVDPHTVTNEKLAVTAPTKAGLDAVQRLAKIVRDEDDEYTKVVLSLRDDMGIEVREIDLSDGELRTIVDSKGNITGLVFNVSKRIKPHDYAAIDSLGYFWNN